MELFKVVDVDEVKKIIDDNFKMEPEPEKIPLLEALGRVLYRDIIAEENVPGFRRSAVDGYALKSKDAAGASESIPGIFEIKGEVKMGEECRTNLDSPGDCVYVPTGGMIPDEADCVVMIEYTEKLDENTVLVNKPPYPGENVVEEKDDTAEGEVVIKKGTTIRPYEAGVLASLGIIEVEVCKKIRCGIISTGDEIVEPSTTPLKGQVRDVNTYLLSTLIEESGGKPAIYGIHRDSFNSMKKVIARAWEECDMVLISGGSSVGKKDQTLEVIKSLENSKILVHGIAIKPGKPTLIGKAGEKIIFGLPGHPLACAVVFKTIVKHCIDRVYGKREEVYPMPCTFTINYHKAKGREEFLPVNLKFVNGNLTAAPILSKSGIISAFSKAWGYIRLSKNLEGIKEGERVMVYKL
ncbi:molybdopterin molybdotransferase MoeA [Fonticella tunisiensis]|uniref:Molybdopterin molybdenumtransferase n=1 Tax=Fonticella tunisiensis TaxID=1096341 RepID=A0A4R7KAX4_9CLOT|nr:molybdopterin molybdotransferase MoeA [Fonticella tunisiensis]TDT52052.1 molybdopterin molybdochelatase [Fonticella tunisiensis]